MQAQQGLRAELFGESDDEDEAALAPEEPVEELTTKQKLIELANRKRKEQVNPCFKPAFAGPRLRPLWL